MGREGEQEPRWKGARRELASRTCATSLLLAAICHPCALGVVCEVFLRASVAWQVYFANIYTGFTSWKVPTEPAYPPDLQAKAAEGSQDAAITEEAVNLSPQIPILREQLETDPGPLPGAVFELFDMRLS